MYGQIQSGSTNHDDVQSIPNHHRQQQLQQQHQQQLQQQSSLANIGSYSLGDLNVGGEGLTKQPSSIVHRRSTAASVVSVNQSNRNFATTSGTSSSSGSLHYLPSPNSNDTYTSASANVESPYYRNNYSDPSSQSSSAFPLTKKTQQHTASGTKTACTTIYRHNAVICCFLLPMMGLLLFSHTQSSMIPVRVFMLTLLVLYGLDLSNQRSAVMFSVWIGVFVNCITSGWFWLLAEETDDDGGWTVLEIMFKVTVQAIIFSIAACWLKLQFSHSSNSKNRNKMISVASRIHNDIGDGTDDEGGSIFIMSSRDIEAVLHSVIPPAFAAVTCQFICNLVASMNNIDAACALAPYVFALTLAVAMFFLGSCRSSFEVEPTTTTMHNQEETATYSTNGNSSNRGVIFYDKYSSRKEKLTTITFRYYSIRDKACATGHLVLLLMGPCMIYLSINLGRILWSRDDNSTVDLWYDLILSVTIPCLLHHTMIAIHNYTTSWQSPYAVSLSQNGKVDGDGSFHLKLAKMIFQGNNGRGNLSLSLALITMITSIVAHQRYLLPICHSLAYMMGNTVATSWILSLYWITGTATLLGTFWIWGRQSSTELVVVPTSATMAIGSQQESSLLFGDYQEDVIQIGLAVSGLLFGKAFGLSWNMTPLPILGVLGLTLWISTRMLRYLAILLFVAHATAVVIFTYRFVGIDRRVQIATIPTPIEVSLVHFGLILTAASIVMGLVSGLAVRSNGGLCARTLTKLDVTGQLFVLYMLMLTVLEITLLKLSGSTYDLAGVEPEEFEDNNPILYYPLLAFITSIIAIGISVYMRRMLLLKKTTASIIVSIAIGKSVAVLIDSEYDVWNGSPAGSYVFTQALLTALLCLVVYAPRIFLEPIHTKASARYKRDISGNSALQRGTVRTIALYAFIILPVTLTCTIPHVLFPLVNIISAGETYHTVRVPTFEFIGAVMALWGLSCVSMLNYYLPDGGGEVWKKLSAFSFLLGSAVFFAATALGMSVTEVATNPYASLSSVGSQLILRSKSRTGGWGVICALFAVLLSVTGPLELKERRSATLSKDANVLFRTMIFSLLFGGGVAWFITVQFMSDTQWIFLMLTMLATMTIAFLGTCASVFGYNLELQNFDEVEGLAHTWFYVFALLIFVASVQQILGLGSSHPFGTGGWLSSYLAISSVCMLCFSLAVSHRTEKDASTRGIANVACVMCWLLAITLLLGTFGVAGLVDDFDVQAIFGIPFSVIGIVAVAPVLLILEGETFLGARRVSVTTSQKKRRTSFRLNLPRLKSFNRWFPPVYGTVVMLLAVSFYAVLLRGIIGGLATAQSQEDLFNKFSGVSISSIDKGLAALAQKASNHNLLQASSARLAGSSFWTSNNWSGPLLHLTGALSCIPTLFLLLRKWWFDKSVPSNQISFCIPLNAIPLLVCRGIPSLSVAAFVNILAAIHQYIKQRRDEHIARMEM